MMKWKPAPVYILVALNMMLLFFTLLDRHLVVPVWLQVTGRLHPMILHFPIVLIVAYALCAWFAGSNQRPSLLHWPAYFFQRKLSMTDRPSNGINGWGLSLH